MTSAPLISICIPVYNMSETIVHTVHTALAQTYDNFEIILTDNQSTDGTYEKALAITDPRLKVFRNDSNLGAYGNHNRCLELASGEWIKFLHGDDDLLPACLTEFVEVLKKIPGDTGLIACGAIRLDEHDREFQRTVVPDRLFVMKKAPRALMIQGNMIGTPTMTLIHKARFKQIGWFDRSMEPASDGDAWINLMKHYPSAILPKYLVKLRDDPLVGVQAKAKLATKFCNQIFRQIDKWYHLDEEQSRLPFEGTDYGSWACTESFPYWSGALRFAFSGEFLLLKELSTNLKKRNLFYRSFFFFLKNRLTGHGIHTFKKKPWHPDMLFLDIEYPFEDRPKTIVLNA